MCAFPADSPAGHGAHAAVAACVIGASIVYVDALVRLVPGQQSFRIQDSNGFLACSLSLSFGVMVGDPGPGWVPVVGSCAGLLADTRLPGLLAQIFSALFSMLPTAKHYLIKDWWSEQTAGFILMACFVGGFFGIQILSRFLHQFLPSHVVDCDHTHDDPPR